MTTTAINTLPELADDAATERSWTDTHAATIIKQTPKRITVRRDKATLLNGAASGEDDALTFEPGGFCGHTSGVQRYAIESDAEGTETTYSLRHNGRWVRVGGSATSRGGDLIIGHRREYRDFNF